MSGNTDDGRDVPLEQEELTTLEAELRAAIQHRHAALERVREAQREMEELLERARTLLGGGEGNAGG
jgi:hypothetical protein